jgi:hypothetical protein
MSLVSGVELVMSSSIIGPIAGRYMGATAPRISGYALLINLRTMLGCYVAAETGQIIAATKEV